MINSVHVPYRQISEDQKTQYAQNDGQCHEKTGYTVEEPEESPETDDGHGGPYRRYTVGIEPAEYDGCCYGQRECPCPSAVRYLSDTFFCFHNLHVFGGNAIPGFRGFLAVRLHRQGFGKIPEPRARMIFPETVRPDLAGGNGRAATFAPRIGMASSFPFPAVPVLGNESVRVNPASKVTEASKATPFFPLNPLIRRVEPEEKSCSRCWSVSSLFRNLRYTVSPHPLLSQRALFSLTMMCPFCIWDR